jgi:hypothetical protein
MKAEKISGQGTPYQKQGFSKDRPQLPQRKVSPHNLLLAIPVEFPPDSLSTTCTKTLLKSSAPSLFLGLSSLVLKRNHQPLMKA